MTRTERRERTRKAVVMANQGAKCQLCGTQQGHLQLHATVYTRTVGSDIHHETHEITICDACKQDEEWLKVDDDFLIGLFCQTGLSRRRLYALAVSLRRFFANYVPREGKFQELTEFLERKR